MLTVNEKSVQRLNVTFDNMAGAVVAPTTIQYAVHCMATGTVLQAFTAATPANPTVIDLSVAINTIQDDRNSAETRRVIIKANEALSDQLTAQYDYEVANLTAIT